MPSQATATGQAAVVLSLLTLVHGGTHLVASNRLRGGTVDLLTDTFSDAGIDVTFVDPAEPSAWAAAIRPDTRAFFLESIRSPLATLPDLPALADIAHSAGVPVVVDSTLESAAQSSQGLETLERRVARHTADARAVAAYLATHPAVAQVHHPGIPGHPGAALAARDFPDGVGSVFFFDLAAGPEAVAPFFDALEVFQLGDDVGDVRSLVCHPATTTHCRMTPQQRAAAGISEATVRLAIGLEPPEELTLDLDRALVDATAAVVEGLC